MKNLVEELSALTIGTVESVSPNEIQVLLELDAPQATAFNAGVPMGFPRINNYVLIPNETGAVVGLIIWIGIERSAFPKRTGLKDFGLVDLPFPLRKITLTPVGTLISVQNREKNTFTFQLKRGISTFPSVGDPVLLPTGNQLHSIIEAQGADRRIIIGISPLASNSIVSVDPDKLFGRHLAVLGNTGSGKSCTVAGLIRWSLETAKKEREKSNKEGAVNARFIILDPNGEYINTFCDLETGVRIFRVPPTTEPFKPISLPAWMWNSHEWSAFASAQPGAQRPLLLQALRDMRAGAAIREPARSRVVRLSRSYKARIEQMITQGISAYAGFPNNRNCGNILRNIEEDFGRYAEEVESDLSESLKILSAAANSIANARHWQSAASEGFNDFSETDLLTILDLINKALGKLPPVSYSELPSEDAPIPFEVDQLADHLEQLASDIGTGQAVQFVSFLSMRIRMMLADRRLGPIVGPKDEIKFEQWLTDYIGDDGARNGQIAILDLSLIPSDVLHIIVAVIARIIFEAIQRYRKLQNEELPTVLVLEEAHTFIQRRRTTEEGNLLTADQMCRQTFERIAREGRKFGLGLVLSSQRPSEISPTVLSQCNTFILHRIVNDRDQELVGSLVPDNLGGLLKELPSLPSRQAILLGWATPIPVLVEINELPGNQCPQSSDPEFWSVWTGAKSRKINWGDVKKDWTNK